MELVIIVGYILQLDDFKVVHFMFYQIQNRNFIYKVMLKSEKNGFLSYKKLFNITRGLYVNKNLDKKS